MYGLSTLEMEQLEAEVDEGPDDEIVPLGPLMAKLLIGAVRAGNTEAMRYLDRVMAHDGVPRNQRRQKIHGLKALGPVKTDDTRAYNDLMKFLKGLQ